MTYWHPGIQLEYISLVKFIHLYKKETLKKVIITEKRTKIFRLRNQTSGRRGPQKVGSRFGRLHKRVTKAGLQFWSVTHGYVSRLHYAVPG